MPPNKLRNISIISLVIGMALFTFLIGIPALYTFIISFQDYQPLMGMSGSPWVGFANYSDFVSGPFASRVISNSFIIFLASTIIAIMAAIPTAGAVGGMNPGKTRSASAIALLLPAFIPDLTLAFLATHLLSTQTFMSPSAMRIMVILFSAIRPAAICAFVGACAASLFNNRGKSVLYGAATGVAIGIAINIARVLSSNYELIMLLYNPGVFSATDTIDTWIYRSGLEAFRMSPASAAWAIRTVIQILVAALAAMGVYICVRAGNDESPGNIYNGGRDNKAGAIPGAIGALALLVGLLFPLAYSSATPAQFLQSSIVNSIFITVFSAALYGILLFTLAAWLYLNINKKAALVLILLMASLANNIIGEFLFYHQLGFVNTYIGVIFANAANIAFVLPLAYLARLKNPKAGSLQSLTRAMLPFLIAFGGLFAAKSWGNYIAQMIFTRQLNHWGLAMLLRDAMFHGHTTLTVSIMLWFVLPILAIAAATVFLFIKTFSTKTEDI
ncbi:MAG: hypothetical protein FWE42_01430 [Defluviitaleaceae bacterium]|nr:hypothetical protein [Defluviitaleaceae bacterium]